MCTADSRGPAPGSVAEALAMAQASVDYLNSPAAQLDGTACGPALTALGVIQAKFTAAHAGFLRRFDAADGHDGDGYGTTAGWLAAMTQLTTRDARGAVRQMRLLSRHRHLADAIAAGQLPAGLRPGTDQILADAAAGGASLHDLAMLAARVFAQWQAHQPSPGDDDGFNDRHLQVATTFGGAGVIRGDLTPECAAAVQA